MKNGEWYHDFKVEGIIATDLLPLVGGVGEVTHYMLAIQWQMQQKTESAHKITVILILQKTTYICGQFL